MYNPQLGKKASEVQIKIRSKGCPKHHETKVWQLDV